MWTTLGTLIKYFRFSVSDSVPDLSQLLQTGYLLLGTSYDVEKWFILKPKNVLSPGILRVALLKFSAFSESRSEESGER